MTDIEPHQHHWLIYMPTSGSKPEIIANSSCTVCGLTPEAVANEAAIKTLLDEVERLREIARDVAHTPPAYREQPEEWYCVHCGAIFIPTLGHGGEYEEAVAYRKLRHSAACAVTKARALLGEASQESQESQEG